MKLAILSRNSKLYSTRRLVEAARERGHTVRVLDPLRCYMKISEEGFEMHYKGVRLTDYNAVIPRVGASITRYGTAVLRQFELMGCYTPNPSDAILKARDKLRTHQLLAAQSIGLPATVFGDNPDDTDDLLSMLGKPPHVIKLSEGTQGAGVMLAEKLSSARGMVEALRGLHADFLVQEFIAEAKGADLRCFVVGGKVVGAMRRQAASGDFRSNLHRGGSAKAIMPTRDEVEVAVRAAKVLGLNVAGVDLIRAKRGPLVLEVNSSPGLEGIEFATGMDIAGVIIDHVCASEILSNTTARPRRAKAATRRAPASKRASSPSGANKKTTARKTAETKTAATSKPNKATTVKTPARKGKGRT